MVSLTVIDNVDIGKHADKLENDSGLWTFAANTWYKLLEPYTPMDTGTMFKSVTIEPGKIHYMMDYSVYVYNGDGMNFQKTHHALASAHWDRAGRAAQEPKLIKALDDYVKSKGILK